MVKYIGSEKSIALMFLIIPTIFVIIGLLFFPYPLPEIVRFLLPIPLFSSLIILGIGAVIKKGELANKLKIFGWMIFAFYWSTQPNTLYWGEERDFVNAILCVIGVFVLFYVAYHEWLSLKKKQQIGCLNWIAGAACIAGFIYFGIELTPLRPWLIETVTAQSGWLLNLFIGNIEVYGVNIFYKGSYVVSIIFACTAVQSIVLFVGMIVALQRVDIKRKFYGLLVTVVPIYFLNLIRNALVAYLVKDNPDFFFMAHNVIGKGGSLIALVILLFIVIKIVPELLDEIICLTDLYKRNGPLEKFVKKYILGKK